MTIEAARYRHRVVIQEAQEAADSYGQAVVTWTTFATVWASVEPLQGREFFNAEQQQAEVTTRIRIRYLAGVTAKMRVNWGGRLYNIRSVIDERERRRAMQLMCDEQLGVSAPPDAGVLLVAQDGVTALTNATGVALTA